ncbi:MAG TPA: hypothetical protein VKF36_00685 [Syntrophorhabdales bacterium]|nr:hypothetical protein [Syntrophorhabdales bacterium]
MKPIFFYRALLFITILFLSWCAKVGPDFVQPNVDVLPNWIEAGDRRIDGGPVDHHPDL